MLLFYCSDASDIQFSKQHELRPNWWFWSAGLLQVFPSDCFSSFISSPSVLLNFPTEEETRIQRDSSMLWGNVQMLQNLCAPVTVNDGKRWGFILLRVGVRGQLKRSSGFAERQRISHSLDCRDTREWISIRNHFDKSPDQEGRNSWVVPTVPLYCVIIHNWLLAGGSGLQPKAKATVQVSLIASIQKDLFP